MTVGGNVLADIAANCRFDTSGGGRHRSCEACQMTDGGNVHREHCRHLSFGAAMECLVPGFPKRL
jgi:hypothetical protein